MRHRHFSNSFMRSGIDQRDSNHMPVEQSHIPMGPAFAPDNGPFVGPRDHMSRGGVQSDSRWNSECRANKYPSSNVSMEVQRFVPVFSGSPVDPYSHSSITENTSLTSLTPVGHAHCTNYNVPRTRDVEPGLSNCTPAIGGTLKRKRPDISGSCESGSLSSFYSAGSSSSSSQMPMEKPADCQSVPPYRGSLTIDGEDSPRNVRRRSRLELEPSMTRTHVPSHPSHCYQSTGHPANYSASVQPANLDANSGQWNCVPRYAASSHGRILPPDINGSRHEMHQFHVGGSSANVDACHHDPVFSRHPVSSSQNLHAPHAPSMSEGHVNHSRRVQSSYGNGSRYSHHAHGGTSSTNLLSTPPENFSSRYSRHCSTGGWRSSYRSGRPRVAVERFQSILDVTESYDRMGHETIMMGDRASFYGSSRNFSDQYRDLRLDIDSMSYEELLNLEERMGIVSTGLSEDSMSKCLREKVYCSSDQNHEEIACPICLEEYKNGDKVGMMEKCGHDYHVDCIKKWLLMKKLCPICKSECSNREPTEG